jgi:hypothetical protein
MLHYIPRTTSWGDDENGSLFRVLADIGALGTMPMALAEAAGPASATAPSASIQIENY